MTKRAHNVTSKALFVACLLLAGLPAMAESPARAFVSNPRTDVSRAKKLRNQKLEKSVAKYYRQTAKRLRAGDLKPIRDYLSPLLHERLPDGTVLDEKLFEQLVDALGSRWKNTKFDAAVCVGQDCRVSYVASDNPTAVAGSGTINMSQSGKAWVWDPPVTVVATQVGLAFSASGFCSLALNDRVLVDLVGVAGGDLRYSVNPYVVAGANRLTVHAHDAGTYTVEVFAFPVDGKLLLNGPVPAQTQTLLKTTVTLEAGAKESFAFDLPSG